MDRVAVVIFASRCRWGTTFASGRLRLNGRETAFRRSETSQSNTNERVPSVSRVTSRCEGGVAHPFTPSPICTFLLAVVTTVSPGSPRPAAAIYSCRFWKRCACAMFRRGRIRGHARSHLPADQRARAWHAFDGHAGFEAALRAPRIAQETTPRGPSRVVDRRAARVATPLLRLQRLERAQAHRETALPAS